MTTAPPHAPGIDPRPAHRPARGLLLLCVGVALCGFGVWREGSVSGQDEYWLTFRTPMEMLDRGDLWTPWLNGEPRLQKPPLIYWLICASYEVLGRNLLAARIWSVLCGAGMALVAARLDRKLFRRDGTLAAALVLSSVGVAIESRRAMLDLPMGFFTVLAVLCGVGWAERRRLRDALGAGAALALASLTKGPVALLFAATATIAGVIAWHGASPTGTPRRPLHALGALGAMLAIALPWPIAMAASWPQLGDVLAEQTEARQFQFAPLDSIGPVLGGGLALLLPWSLAVVFALCARQPDEAARRASRWLTLWIALSAAPFLFMKSFERYLIPMVVPAALLTARWLESIPARAAKVQGVIAISLLGVPTLALCAFTIWFGLAWITPLVALCLFGFLLRRAMRGGDARVIAWGAGLLLSILLGGVYPAIGINDLPLNLPGDLDQHGVAVYRISQPGMLSMRAGHSVIAIRDGDDLRDRLRNFDGYVFVAEERIDAFVADAQGAELHADLVQTFRSFFSRKTWLRFAREDATADDWRAAFSTRSLDGLRPGFACFRVKSG